MLVYPCDEPWRECALLVDLFRLVDGVPRSYSYLFKPPQPPVKSDEVVKEFYQVERELEIEGLSVFCRRVSG